MKTRLLSIAFTALVVAVYFCLILYTRGQAFTPRRPFIFQLTAASNQTPEQMAEFQLAFRWVAYDLGTNALNVNTWTDRIQGAIWRMDDNTKQPAYTTNDGVALNNTHWLTNNVLGTCLNGQTNMCFGLILTFPSTAGTQIRPTFFNNGLPGAGSGSEDQYSLEQEVYNVGIDRFHPLGYLYNSESTYGISDVATNGYPLTNVWHTLMLGTAYSNAVANLPNIYIVTNGQFLTNFHAPSWTAGAGWGGSYSPTGNRSNFPTSLGHNYWRNSAVSYSLKEFWIWTNTALAYGLPPESVRTSFWYYASTNYGF